MALDNYPLLEAVIDANLAGDNVLVAGVPGRIIRVYQLFIVLNADSTLTFKDGAATALTGPMAMLANGSIVFDFEAQHWFTTSDGNDFIVNQSAPAELAGRLYYVQFTPIPNPML